jgi:hypothetical protein
MKIFVIRYFDGEGHCEEYFTCIMRAAHNLQYWQKVDRHATIKTIDVADRPLVLIEVPGKEET